MKVQFPDGTAVRAHDFYDVEDERPMWALYLDEGWHERKIDWPHRHVEWPDFGTPIDEADAFEAVDETWRRAQAGELIDIACRGGFGRTGTVLACLATLAGVPVDKAVGWVRSEYAQEAVETNSQVNFVWRFADWNLQRARN